MRLSIPGARSVLTAASVLAVTATCQLPDVLQSPGLEDVALSFTTDSVLVVAAPLRPTVVVTVGGAAYAQARVRLTTSDTSVVAVHGDTLVPRRRGVVTLTVTLESSALPRDPPSLTRSLVVVADTVTVDSSAVRFSSLGDTVTLAAAALDATGAAIAGTAARWSSSDTSVVTVTQAGRLAARGNGTATIRAMVDRDTAAVAVTVAQVLVRFTLEPMSLRLDALTATAAVVATGRDARGNSIAALVPSAWSVGDATVVSVSAAGQVTALRNGATHLYATRGGVRDSVPVTVAQRATLVAITPRPVPALTSLGAQTQLIARAFDRLGVALQSAQPAWFTPDPALVRVSDGLVTALATGTARIVASLDAVADTAAVTISNDPVAVTIAPDSALAISLGDTLVFRAVARNGRGDSVGATLSWRTPDSTVARVQADGHVLTLAVGTARVIVSVAGHADTGLAKVTNVPTAIDIAPAARLFTSLGDVDTLPVTITNARGAALPPGAVTWSSDDATIARVSTAGVVTARDTGETVVRATSGSLADSVLVTVQNLPHSIVIGGPSVDTLTAVGQSLTFVVDVRNARGVSITNYLVAWHSTNRTTVDTVLPSGVAVAVGWGTTLLVAGAGEVADTVRLTAKNPTVLYVSNAMYQAPRVGTRARPYARIQEGVDAADAGDTVAVLMGLGRYSESVNLVRRIVLTGDSIDFIGRGRNFADLPLISHDTGAYAIRAHTTAPVAIQYLNIVHTLDGPALDADGSDVLVAWVAVNRPGTVTSPIGRGISIAHSNAGSAVNSSRVYNVSGYGIRLYHVNGAGVNNDSVDMVVPAPDGSDGSGITATGGLVGVWGSAVQRTVGPMIRVDSTSNFTLGASVFRGIGGMVRLTDVTGAAKINQHNAFYLEYVPWAAGDPYGPNWEPVIHFVRQHAATLVNDNTFSGALELCAPVFCPVLGTGWIWSQDGVGQHVEIGRNTFHGGGVVITSQNENVSAFQNRADSVTSYYVAQGSDAFLSEHDTVRAATEPCIVANGVNASQFVGGQYDVHGGVFDGCARWRGAVALDVDASGVGGGAWLRLRGVRVTGMPHAVGAVRLRGGSLTIDSSTFRGPTDTVPGRNDVCTELVPCAGVRAEAYELDIRNSVISGFHGLPGLGAEHTTTLATRGNVIHNNRIGVLVGEGVAVPATGWPLVNDVFDNDSAGFSYTGSSPLTLPNEYWWGDGRGPRSGAMLAATGDTIIAANPVSLTVSAAAAPGHVGTLAAALRAVRGSGQTAPASAGIPLATAFTVRVVDANGLPVPGVTVQFTVTGGGGNLGGLVSVTVVSNASGLAEATLTPGTSPGTNTVAASSSSLGSVTFTATGT